MGSNWFKGPPLFYLDFVLFPALALWASYEAVAAQGWWSPLTAIAGFLLFTLTEYWVHRVALHEVFYHGTHEYHHKNPRGYVVFPVWYTPLIFAIFWAVMPLGVYAGFVWGFVWFTVWHHILHHFDLTWWPRSVKDYAQWHLAHHHHDDVNFGITVPWWDYVFGTYARVKPPETRT